MSERRGWGSGSVFQRASDGRWIARYKALDGSQRYVTGKDRDQVLARLSAVPRIAVSPDDAEARVRSQFWAKVRLDGPRCWVWTGSLNTNGYGHFRGWSRLRDGSVMAHRVAYEWLIGPVPEGLDLDHTCGNRACVNPAHLEPVTRKVNLTRAWASRRLFRTASLEQEPAA